MTRRATEQRPGVALQSLALNIFVGLFTGPFTVRRAMTGRALQSTMPFRMTEQVRAGARGVGLSSVGLIRRLAHAPHCVENAGVADLPAVLHGVPGMAALTTRLLQPPLTSSLSHREHVAMTVLALNAQRAIGVH